MRTDKTVRSHIVYYGARWRTYEITRVEYSFHEDLSILAEVTATEALVGVESKSRKTGENCS